MVQVTEYFHPRVEEVCGSLPAGLGRYVEESPRLAAFIDRRINKGRRIRTDGFSGFAMLWVIGGLRRFRRKLLRHQVESVHLERWYALALGTVGRDYDLAVEILKNTLPIANLIRTGAIHQIGSFVETGMRDGMNTLEHHVKLLLESGQISEDEARLALYDVNSLH